MNERKLNASQKTAVEYLDNPLLIVAGAGTGKTTVITEKIVYLIENGFAKPEEILALTFTDKAAQEMQTRVDEKLDVGYSEIQISTFHSFCQKLLEDRGLDIGLTNDFKLLTQTSAWILIKSNLNKFDLNYYRPLGNPFKHIHELIKHFSKCKDELISPEEYLVYAENHTEDKDRLLEIAKAYKTYTNLLLQNNYLDFGDLIYYSNVLLKNRTKILSEYQKKYKFILVDEFQDVNWAQYSLVKLLNNQNSQLTVVGDDDQSIYAFRGASVSNILRFKEDFPNAKEIVLNENYRSTQDILDLAYKSIQNNNPDRLEAKLKINKKLVSKVEKKGKKKPANNSVVHLHSNTIDDEVSRVVDEIVALKNNDSSLSWDDFAILIRANSHAEPFIEKFEKSRIPFEFLASSGLYRQPIILDSLSFFKVAENIRDDVSFFRLLSIPFLNLSENDLQKITYYAKKKSISYYETIKRCAELDVSNSGQIICQNLISVIHEGIKSARYSKPTIILYNFLNKIGYLKFLAQKENEGDRGIIRQIYHLKQFFDHLVEFETINPDPKLYSFINHYNSISEAGERGNLQQQSDTPDSVNILTIHSAKGLEFKYVFVVNLVEDRFPSRRRGEGIELPTDLIKERLPEGDGHIEEERRLFYVAITRARERLYLCSSDNYGGERTKKLSRFLNELGYFVNADSLKQTTALPEYLGEENIKASFVFELPKAFSFSQIKTYENCPHQYKLAHILKIPTKGTASFSFGQTMHNTLQAFYSKVKELNSAEQVSLFPLGVNKEIVYSNIKVPTFEELITIYEKSWIGDWYKNENQREDYYKKGKEILETFYKAQDGNWTIPEKLESSFKIKVGDYFINGRIDRIDKLSDGSLEIIDYKTGKSKETLNLEDKEQLFIYQIAVSELVQYKHLGSTKKLTYFYLNDNIQTSFIGDEKSLNKVKEKFLKTIKKIYSKNFDATPSQFACDNCDFKEICEYRV